MRNLICHLVCCGHHGQSSVPRLVAQHNQQVCAKVFLLIEFPIKGSRPAGSTCQVSLWHGQYHREDNFHERRPCLILIAVLIPSKRSFWSDQENTCSEGSRDHFSVDACICKYLSLPPIAVHVVSALFDVGSQCCNITYVGGCLIRQAQCEIRPLTMPSRDFGSNLLHERAG